MGLGARIKFDDYSVGKWLDHGQADIEVDLGDGFKFCAHLFQSGGWILQGQVKEFNRAVYSNHSKVQRGKDPYLLVSSFWHKLPENLSDRLRKPSRAEMRKAFKDHVKKRYIKTGFHK